jgi:hypothetical protein
VTRDEPFAHLPDSVELDLDDVAVLLAALDRAAELAPPGSEDHRAIRAATRLITSKIWPELGGLLDDEG